MDNETNETNNRTVEGARLAHAASAFRGNAEGEVMALVGVKEP